MSAGGRCTRWPMFVPITFELTILCAAFGARPRHARAEWPAPPASSDLRDALLRAAQRLALLPVHREHATRASSGSAPSSFSAAWARNMSGRWAMKTLARTLAHVTRCGAGSRGCRQDMADQAQLKPLGPSTFLAEDAASQPSRAHTVARDDVAGARRRRTVTRALLERGRERFDIYCAVCHGRTGEGQGMIVQRGFPPPPTFHQPRLREAPRAAFLRRDHQWLRRDVSLRLARRAGGSLGDRRLHPRAATQPKRHARRCRAGGPRATGGRRRHEPRRRAIFPAVATARLDRRRGGRRALPAWVCIFSRAQFCRSYWFAWVFWAGAGFGGLPLVTHAFYDRRTLGRGRAPARRKPPP